MFLLVLSTAGVVQLTNETFDQHENKFVKFFAPWCGHCKALAPHWTELADEYEGITIGEVDCTVQHGICNKYNVHGYPTIKLFYNGSVYDYEKGRNKKALALYLDSMLKPQFEYIDESKISAIAAERKMNPYFILYTPSLENPEFTQFKGDVAFFTVSSKTRKLVVNRDGDLITFKGKFEAAELRKFIDENNLPYVPELSQDTYRALAQKNITTLVVDPTADAELITTYRAQMAAAMKKGPEWAKHFNPSYINGVHWEKYIETFKPHNKADYPFILIIDPNDEKKYYSKLWNKKDDIAEVAIELMNGIINKTETVKNKDEL